MGTSKVLGIISLCIGWLSPLAGAILAIIGLSIKKERKKENRDFWLNYAGLFSSLALWIIEYFILKLF
jgi:uncharacterized membrane protein